MFPFRMFLAKKGSFERPRRFALSKVEFFIVFRVKECSDDVHILGCLPLRFVETDIRTVVGVKIGHDGINV